MARIEDLDRNFAADKIEGEYQFYDLWDLEQISVEGLWPGTFCRMDPVYLNSVPEGVRELAWNTSGGLIRFRMNSRKFAVHMDLRSGSDMSHMPRTGSSGLDIYVGMERDCRFLQSTRPEIGQTSVETECLLPVGEKNVTLYLPLYNGIKSLKLGFPKGERPWAPEKHSRGRVIFYGSSITQGGCASRTGNSYVNMLGRMLDCTVHNLGFSGCCKGEPELAEYIASLSMDVLVFDYDHNASDAQYLRKTHLPFLKRILKSHPNLPMILISKPDFDADPMADVRRSVILDSFAWLKAQGVPTAFIDGEKLFDGPMRDACTVDRCHPNDLGFYRMAKSIYPVLFEMLEAGSAT